VASLPGADHPVEASPGDIGLMVHVVDTGDPKETTPAVKELVPLTWPALLNSPNVTPATKVATAPRDATTAATLAARFALGFLIASLHWLASRDRAGSKKGDASRPPSHAFQALCY
jgi:hypothetical protein